MKAYTEADDRIAIAPDKAADGRHVVSRTVPTEYRGSIRAAEPCTLQKLCERMGIHGLAVAVIIDQFGIDER
ncbi:hypothetical protein L288_18505 [Sphingobium quisquiliarum P25]|uniref:Uncharacterized protein n=1 Tax=Sphingobium quisquiliarum P25 TaxID=1329909 RepID=T0HLM8_9SPHN|nr:hypothetical protein L288_18505 [Sphingobium quisquiliarum P25]